MTPRAVLRIAHQQGRRGGVLTLFGLVWVFIGVGVIVVPMDRFSRPGPGGPLEFADGAWTGVIWVVCGLIALVNGMLRRRLHNEDALGYAALIIPPTLWAVGFAWSFLSWVFTYDDAQVYGRESAILYVFVFGVMVGVVRIIAKWPDDFDVTPGVPVPGSAELALLDRLQETKPENDARGQRARVAHEDWVTQSRTQSEANIASSAAENDRMIAAELSEHDRERDGEGP